MNETVEQVAARIAMALFDEIDPSDLPLVKALIADPAFRRLMAEELVKVDMEPVVVMAETTISPAKIIALVVIEDARMELDKLLK